MSLKMDFLPFRESRMASIHLFFYGAVNVNTSCAMRSFYRRELLCVWHWNLFTLINTKHLFFQVTESYDEVAESLFVRRVKMTEQCCHNDCWLCEVRAPRSVVTADWLQVEIPPRFRVLALPLMVVNICTICFSFNKITFSRQSVSMYFVWT